MEREGIMKNSGVIKMASYAADCGIPHYMPISLPRKASRDRQGRSVFQDKKLKMGAMPSVIMGACGHPIFMCPFSGENIAGPQKNPKNKRRASFSETTRGVVDASLSLF
jgi:hypothetical protein